MSQSGTHFTEFVTGGAAAGAWVSLNMGGMGLAFSGTAVGIGFTPVTMAGAVAGAASYGLFRAVVEGDGSALSAATLGGLGGAGVSLQVGGMGLAFKGTAMSLGIAPVAAAGAVVGLAIYGLVQILDDAPKEAASEVFTRMEDKISGKEAYLQALMEIDPIFAEDRLLERFAALEIEEDLATLKRRLLDSPSVSGIVHQDLLAASQLLSPERNIELEFTEFDLATFATSAEKAYQSSESADDLSAVATQEKKVWQKCSTIQGYLGSINAIAFSQDGTLLATNGDDRIVKLWNVKTGRFSSSFSGQGKEGSAVAISPDGSLIAGGSFDGKVTLWNIQRKSLHKTLMYLNRPHSHDGFVHAAIFSPDGKYVISGGSDAVIRVWNTQTGKIVKTLNGHSASVLSLAIAPNGQTLVSGSADKTIRVWRCEDWSLLNTLEGHQDWVFSVAADSKSIVSGSSDRTIRVWETTTATLRHTLTGHQRGVSSVALSPDGQLLASGSQDGTVKLWHLGTGEVMQTLIATYPVAFSSDGYRLATGGGKQSIHLWHLGSVVEEEVDQVPIGQWWEVLSVSHTASAQEVKAAYRGLAQQFHPDINRSVSAKQNMQRIVQAYQAFRQEKRC